MNDLIIKGVIALVLVAALSFGVHRFLAYEQNIGYQKAVGEYAIKEKAAREASLEKERFMRNQVTEAERNAQKRDEEKRTAVAAANATARSLRDTITNQRNGLSTATLDACRKTAHAALVVFSECAVAYGELAEEADGHANDALMLEDAWPKDVGTSVGSEK